MKRVRILALFFALACGSVLAPAQVFNYVSLDTIKNSYSAASVLRARDYGISPTNTAIQNDTGFATLKTAMQASATTVWRVMFEPGTYHYTNNRWLFNVQNFICECYGSIFQNDSASVTASDGIPVFNRDMFDDTGDVSGGSSAYVNGYLINTAAAGAASVTTTTAGNAANFAAGNRVMIYGYDQQQAGYPPNMRYFEEKTVLSVNAGTGVVTLTSQLQNSYDSRWWDTANYSGTGLAFGAPRILNLDRTNYKRPMLLWFRGATFNANSVTTSFYTIQLTADVLVLEDVTGVGFNIGETDRAYCIRCKMAGNQSTPDKMVDRLIIQDSVIDPNPGFASALTGCPGINTLTVIRSRLLGSIGQCGPRNLMVQDTDITPAASAFQGIGTASTAPIREASISSTRIFNTGGISFGFTNVLPANTLTVGAVSGTTLQLTWNAAAMTVADEIDYGMTLTNLVNGNTGVITGIWLSGGNTLNISGTWAAPSVADVFSFYDVAQLSDGGGNVIVGAQVPFFRAPPGPTSTTGLTLSGSPTVSDSLFFKAVNQAATNQIEFQNQSYGLQIRSNNGGTLIGYLSGNTLQMSNGSSLNGDTLNANSAGLAVNQGTKTVNIGTGTTTGTVTIGGGSNAVTIAASAGNLTLSNVTTGTNADFMCMASGNKVTLQASACTISSRRFKEGITPLSGSALAAVDGITVERFRMKSAPNPDPNYARPQVGLLAEDVEKFMPDCVIYEDDLKTPKSYRSECVLAYTIKALQELRQQRETR